MISPRRSLSECVGIRSRFLRSVNLERDYRADTPNGQYIVTPTSRQVLRRILEGLTPDSTYRAWTVTGPYGVGKSAFAVFLTKLLCRQTAGSKAARKHLRETDESLAKELEGRVAGANGMFPVAVTARRAPAGLCLVEAIHGTLSQVAEAHRRPLVAECRRLLRDARKGAVIDSRHVTVLMDSLALAAKKSGYAGLLFVVDELGKLLEYAARTPQNADVFVLQEMAEHVSRSGKFPSLLLGFLHQSFEQYGEHLSGLTRKEWGKIHGRFEDVAFLEPTEQVIRMIAAAIEWTGTPLTLRQRTRIRQVAATCARNGVCPPGMQRNEFERICLQAYPLHPVTVVALPVIFRRFGQNERSLFSYLSSLEPGGFRSFLQTHSLADEALDFLRLSHVFDYFVLNFGAGLFRQPHARRWLEAADVLDRKQDLAPVHAELVKTIGVLGALGEFSHLSATDAIIAASLGDAEAMPARLRKAMACLLERSILTHRRFNDTYRIWEGSDVDVDERVAEGERQLRGTGELAESIQRYLPPRPLVARRHNLLTGSLRYFSVAYADDPAQIQGLLAPAEGAAGQVLVCLSSSPPLLQTFKGLARSTLRHDVVFAIPQQTREIQSAVTELAALRWAWKNTPELRDDRVARREINLRIIEAEHSLRQTLGALLDPRKEPWGSECLWYYKGKRQEARRPADVSQRLSDICDRIYEKTPWIRNELIVRKTLSSAAAAARRNLIERMLCAPGEPVLGIASYRPERSIYESVLRSTGLHVQDADGQWRFSDPPKGEDHGLYPAWQRLGDGIFGSQGEPRDLDTVYRELAEPPYGLMDGLHPVLLCAYMLAHPDEVTLYREGTFVPEPGIADFEILMRRPELYGVAGSRVSGGRAAVVRRLATGLDTRPATVPVVRRLFGMVKQLPELAWRTKKLSEPTLRLRQAFEKAKAPDRFLFTEAPEALGMPPFPEHGVKEKDIEKLFQALNRALEEWDSVATAVCAEAKAILLEACGFDPDERGWRRLREAAARLECSERDPLVQLFLRRVVEAPPDEQGVASVLALVANRPPAHWTDNDVERFPDLAKGLAEPIRRAMARAGLGAEIPSVLCALSPQQRAEAEELANALTRALPSPARRQPAEILRAALLLLAERLHDTNEVDK